MLIIGIAGGTGSGKTTVVRKIMEHLPAGEGGVISQDNYYKFEPCAFGGPTENQFRRACSIRLGPFAYSSQRLERG